MSPFTVEDDMVDLRKKVAKGWACCHVYKQLLGTASSEKRKIQVIQNCVLATTLWLAETWAPSRQLSSELRGFHIAVSASHIYLVDVSDFFFCSGEGKGDSEALGGGGGLNF